MRHYQYIVTMITLLMLVGCMTPKAKRDPAYAAVRPVAIAEPIRQDGAIYHVRNHMILFEDHRARRPGDILTVTLNEQTSGEKDTNTALSKSSTSTITNPTILGATPQFNLPSLLPLANTEGNSFDIELSATNDFSGAGDSDLSNSLSGNITVSVVEVLANGNLMIRGEKVITINNGNEYIRISGMINPRDIDNDNTISSRRIADAQMAYVGDGALSDANVMGWLSRFFVSALMPF